MLGFFAGVKTGERGKIAICNQQKVVKFNFVSVKRLKREVLVKQLVALRKCSIFVLLIRPFCAETVCTSTDAVPPPP